MKYSNVKKDGYFRIKKQTFMPHSFGVSSIHWSLKYLALAPLFM